MPTLQDEQKIKDPQTVVNPEDKLQETPKIDYTDPKYLLQAIAESRDRMDKLNKKIDFTIDAGSAAIDSSIKQAKQEAKDEAFKLSEAYLAPTKITPQQILGDLVHLAGIIAFRGHPGLGAGLAFLGKTVKESDPEFQSSQMRTKFGANLLDQNARLAETIMNNVGANLRSSQSDRLRALETGYTAEVGSQTSLIEDLTNQALRGDIAEMKSSSAAKSALQLRDTYIDRLITDARYNPSDYSNPEELDKKIQDAYDALRIRTNEDPNVGGPEDFRKEVLDRLGKKQELSKPKYKPITKETTIIEAQEISDQKTKDLIETLRNFDTEHIGIRDFVGSLISNSKATDDFDIFKGFKDFIVTYSRKKNSSDIPKYNEKELNDFKDLLKYYKDPEQRKTKAEYLKKDEMIRKLEDILGKK